MPRDGAKTRERILDAAERLVLDNGFSGTSVDKVIAASQTSKGSFFHHFDSKGDLGRALVARIADKDHQQLAAALADTEDIGDPADRLLAFLGWYEQRAGQLSAEDADCLYIAVLTERQLIDDGTSDQIRGVIASWRTTVGELVEKAFAARGRAGLLDAEALADHLFATFEGSFLLSRATGDPTHLRRHLGVLRELLAAVLAD